LNRHWNVLNCKSFDKSDNKKRTPANDKQTHNDGKHFGDLKFPEEALSPLKRLSPFWVAARVCTKSIGLHLGNLLDGRSADGDVRKRHDTERNTKQGQEQEDDISVSDLEVLVELQKGDSSDDE